MRKLISLLTSAALTAVPFANSCITANAAEEVYTYSQGNITLSYTVSDSEASVTDCEGTGESLIIPEVFDNQYTVTSVSDGAFADCDNLVNVTVADTIVSIGESAFRDCSFLNTVYIGDAVTEIGDYAFASCSRLNSFSVSGNNTAFSVSQNMLLSKDGKTLVCYAGNDTASIPSTVTAVGTAAFFGRTDITSTRLFEGIVSIGKYAYAGCTGLSEIDIPDSVTTLSEGCFMSCSGADYVEIGTSVASVPDDCFSMCMALSTLQMPETVTSFGERAFYCCDELTGIYLPETVSYVGENAFGTHYDILKNSDMPIHGFCIFGTKNTAVHIYAKSSGVDFIDLSAPPLGDIDGDGSVTPVDATQLLVEYTYTSMGDASSFTQYQRIVGDINHDSQLDSVDASEILAIFVENSMQ